MADPMRAEISREQVHVDALYQRLDELRDRARARLRRVRLDGPSGSPQNRSERDAFAAHHSDRLGQLDSVEDRLCFGRLDLADGRQYVGRIGLTDAALTPMLIDWRAPAAIPFYQATAARPLGVTRRRHLTTRGREVVALEDEVFDLDSVADGGAFLAGEGAILAAMAAQRTGRMGDIVATIQAEQDVIIRAPIADPLVVQGGPGTGKTAVALHRAAFLLYDRRDRLASSGVLVVGPSRTFLSYIDHVLPSLGETGVVSTTMASLLPGLTATTRDAPQVAAIKGRTLMARVVKRAVRNRQRLPDHDQVVTVLGREILLRRRDLARARAEARTSRRPYNKAREVFVDEAVRALVPRAMDGREVTDNWSELDHDIRNSRDVRVALNLCWMPMTPQGLISELFAKPTLLAAAAPELSDEELALLARPAGSPWTVSDIPLLDEAAELLGVDDAATRREARLANAAREREVAYARQVLASQGNPLVSAEDLADRWSTSGPVLTTAERAAADRSWTYGHIVVDEAQELSPMDWRILLRRCPTHSMTIVGDVGQTHSSAGASSWASALDPALGKGRWRLETLSVNYRTPASIMIEAERRAVAAGVPVSPTVAARDVEGAFAVVEDHDPVAAALAQARELIGTDELSGRLALIAADESIEDLRKALERSDLAALASGPSLLDSRLAVLTPAEAKGLEFDDVIVLNPDGISAASEAGPRDLYVAMTRPTRRLRMVVSQGSQDADHLS